MCFVFVSEDQRYSYKQKRDEMTMQKIKHVNLYRGAVPDTNGN